MMCLFRILNASTEPSRQARSGNSRFDVPVDASRDVEPLFGPVAEKEVDELIAREADHVRQHVINNIAKASHTEPCLSLM
jgi:hypothetical protein